MKIFGLWVRYVISLIFNVFIITFIFGYNISLSLKICLGAVYFTILILYLDYSFKKMKEGE